MSELPAKDYGDFLVAVKTRIRQAQYQALRAANKELLSLYWNLSESIHRKQENLGWGKAVVQTLADDLQAEFPGRNGFSATNLWLMRQFYAEYRDQSNLQSLIGEISWAKNLAIMGRCKDLLERELYLRATVRSRCRRCAVRRFSSLRLGSETKTKHAHGRASIISAQGCKGPPLCSLPETKLDLLAEN